jgi:hypothetical protein
MFLLHALRYVAFDYMSVTNEIRCYGNPKVVNGFFGIMAAYPLTMLLISLANARFVRVLPIIVLISLAISVWWVASRKGFFILVNPKSRTLQAVNFFIRTREIPIASITYIGTRGMFMGAATGIEVTYRKSDGMEKTVGYGTKNFLNPPDLQRVLETLVTINPSLELSAELRPRP